VERDTIIKRTRRLPVKELGTIAGDEEIWEGSEEGASFKLTKEALPIEGMAFYSLSMSGKPEVVLRLSDEFAQVFGEPTSIDANPELPGIIFFSWLSEEVDGRLETEEEQKCY